VNNLQKIWFAIPVKRKIITTIRIAQTKAQTTIRIWDFFSYRSYLANSQKDY
jgi:hypothetical protein